MVLSERVAGVSTSLVSKRIVLEEREGGEKERVRTKKVEETVEEI